ncbi:MAG TPA: hypothetical protein VD758_12705, partial [Gemmatimonadaceae bacterium]|nr:hypothetical protein [Gemmatimonadaceae bacterium]
IRLHTLVLVTASILLLVAPVTVLQAFGVTDVSFPVLALARVLAGLVAVLAAAVVPVPDLPVPVRARALMGLATAYAFLSILTLAQEIAIWSSVAGALLSAECILHSVAFAWLARRERASPRLATSTS